MAKRAHSGRMPPVVILAGGRGARLAPYTSVLPKPLMPIGDRSILEIVIRGLEREGFDRIVLSVGYLSHLIRAVFETVRNGNGNGNGKPGGGHAEIVYLHEEEPLGTAGPLRLLDEFDDTYVVMNGDLLTTLSIRELVEHHRRQGNALTIASQARKTRMDYGVLHVEHEGPGAGRITAYDEKPEITSIVSMGIYVLEPHVRGFIPPGRFDFPDVVQALLAAGERVGSYLFDGLWFDIGRHDDYERAQIAWESGKLALDRVELVRERETA
jgi:NDP-sugar pyrophosphorylase family protein